MVDYSKWKDIEISDDEDDTHPNIDTPSLFRWRHQARVERMAQAKKEKEELDEEKKKILEMRKELENKLTKVDESKDVSGELAKLKVEEEKIVLKEKELAQKEKLTPWNVDTISKSGFTKTVINKPQKRVDENLTEDEKEERMKAFMNANEKLLKEYGMLRKYDDSRRFLQEHPQLVCEDTANYLVLMCINLEMEGKSLLMEHVAHQCICMQYILELSKQLDIDPRGCVSSFFKKILIAEPEYKAGFDDERNSFIERVRKRAKEKLEIVLREQEEEERKARLGPGGLDPIEVMETLPPELKKCFESQDIPLLQETISKMPQEEAAYHMKRCVDSGLWVPDARMKSDEEEDNSEKKPGEEASASTE